MKLNYIILLLIVSVTTLHGQSLVNSVQAHDGGVNKIDVNLNSTYLISSGQDGRAVLWIKEDLQKKKIISGFNPDGGNVSYFMDGKSFISESSTKKLVLWDNSTLKPKKLISASVTDKLQKVYAHPSGRSIIGISGGNQVISWGLAGNLLSNHQIDAKEITGLSFSSDGKTVLLSTGKDGLIFLDLISGKQEKAETGALYSLKRNPVKDYHIAAGKDGLIKIEEDKTFINWNSTKNITALAWTPDGQYLFAGTEDGDLFMLDESGKMIKNQKAHNGKITSIASTDTKLYTSGEDGMINLWDIGYLGIGATQLYAVSNQPGNNMRGVTLLNTSESQANLNFGKYYALIIGIDNYQDSWSALQNAVSDAKALEEVLKTEYKFDEVKTLYNTEASRTGIIQHLEWLVNNVQENDNVLIYYSGHGDFNQLLNKGYWVPVDAKSTSTSYYISNSDLQTYIGGIRSKHTLLVSDACFSGDIFRGAEKQIEREDNSKYYAKVHNLSSRRALTSGGIEPVMDGGKDGHSVFAYYFLKALKQNQNSYLDADALFESLKVPVVNNSEQVPNYNPIKNTGDEGGQFIFLRKQ